MSTRSRAEAWYHEDCRPTCDLPDNTSVSQHLAKLWMARVLVERCDCGRDLRGSLPHFP